MALQQQRAPAWALALEQLGHYLVRAIAARNTLVTRVVVVDADDVRGHAFPAIVADHGARGVVRLRQVVESTYVVALRSAVRKIRDAPRLVERHPSHDAGVAHVTLQNLHPLLGQP